MGANMTFRMDSEIKTQMAAICEQLGMTQSTAFHIFANPFVRAKGVPFAATLQEPSAAVTKVSGAKMLADTDDLLSEYAEDYKRMAE